MFKTLKRASHCRFQLDRELQVSEPGKEVGGECWTHFPTNLIWRHQPPNTLQRNKLGEIYAVVEMKLLNINSITPLYFMMVLSS